MKPLLPSPVKIGLAALCLAAGLSAPSLAGPVPATAPIAPMAATSGGFEAIPVREDWAGNGPRSVDSQYMWRRWHRDNWRPRHHWRPRYSDDWHWRRYRNDWDWPGYHRPYYRGSGLYFSFGLAPPAYRYYAQPRRYYRMGNAHVRWCYARYRSYRAWDNTFQPYYGRRQQCWSPYS